MTEGRPDGSQEMNEDAKKTQKKGEGVRSAAWEVTRAEASGILADPQYAGSAGCPPPPGVAATTDHGNHLVRHGEKLDDCRGTHSSNRKCKGHCE